MFSFQPVGKNLYFLAIRSKTGYLIELYLGCLINLIYWQNILIGTSDNSSHML